MQKQKIANNCYLGFIFLVAISLLWVAFLRFKASFNHLGVDVAIQQLNKRQPLESKSLDDLIAKAQENIALYQNPHYSQDLSRLLYYQAIDTEIKVSTGQVLLKQTQFNIQHSLVYSPANSLLWFQLAKLDFLSHSLSKITIKKLLVSIMTGAYEVGHLLPRLDLCLRLSRYFNEQDKFLLRSQVLIAWEKSPRLFIQQIIEKGKHSDKIKILLENKYPDTLKAMKIETLS